MCCCLWQSDTNFTWRSRYLCILKNLFWKCQMFQLFLSLDVVKEEIAKAIGLKHSTVDNVCLTKNVTYDGFSYRTGMILAHGSLGGVPEFTEIIHMLVLKDNLFFIVRKLSAWHWEHFRAFELKVSPTKDITLVAPDELTDPYPLVDYTVGGVRLIILKRYIQV